MSTMQEMFERAATSLDYWQRVAAMEFSGGVREMLARRRMNQRELAESLGKTEAYISKVLGSGENLTIKQMQRILEPLDAAAHVLVIDRRSILDWQERGRSEGGAAVVGDRGVAVESIYTTLQDTPIYSTTYRLKIARTDFERGPLPDDYADVDVSPFIREDPTIGQMSRGT